MCPHADGGTTGVPGDRSSSLGWKRIGITRLHMEEDAGKSIHDGLVDSAHHTSLDLNRCGTPLAEIVSEPDMRTADEAWEYLTRLKEILLYCGVSGLQHGRGFAALRRQCERAAQGRRKARTKAELKNVNSFRFVRAGIQYEIERQIEVIEAGGSVIQESRLWNAAEGRSYSMRSKEQAHDYRYFPRAGPAATGRFRRVPRRDQSEAPRAARSAPRPHDRRVRTQPAGLFHADRNPRVCRPL